jgi:C4-dicarboxylate-specific signal transduction histidine kinase
MRNSDGDIVQWNVICLDIDGEVRAQDELRLAQKSLARASQAASLAELSASIAHEVNQPLAAIVATSHACRRWLSAEPPNMERAKITLERIIRDANSASEVVSRIRALFSQMGRARSPADLTEVIAEVRHLMADELAVKHIHVETEFDGNLPLVHIDRVQMQQVFVNLIRNAIDALDAVVDSRKLIGLRAVLGDDDAIRVEIRDAGAGVQDPDRVFEPFFTTKTNGMGMGLAICRSIIESHDGRLWAFNNKPHGATFAFTLPIQARESA